MLPSLTDFVAMVGVALVACAACLQLPGLRSVSDERANEKGRWLVGLCFVAMWIPAGATYLPIAAYIRGVTSDFSISTLILVVLGLSVRLLGFNPFERRERQAVFYAVTASALLLYPSALGWGDWDAYRLGWGSWGFWVGLLFLCLVCWLAGLRLLPLLIGIALLAWTTKLMESTNLWDYLFDPWLVCAAMFKSLAAGATQLRRLLRNRIDGTVGSEA